MNTQRMLVRMTGGDDPHALDLLARDHAAVSDLFDTYEELEGNDEKEALVSRIILELTIHSRVEEELFLPTLRQAIGDQEVIVDASVEHAMIRKLMADLHGTKADAWRYDAKVKALGELVKHHVKGEERQMFAEARESDLNLYAIGRQLNAYNAVLQARYELDANGEELAAFLAITTRERRTSIRSRTNPSSGKNNGRARSVERSASASAERRTRRSTRVVAGDC